jgi:hypothetical protein
MSHDADYWQKRATEVRAEAEKTSRLEDKRELLDIAAGYEQLGRGAHRLTYVRGATGG